MSSTTATNHPVSEATPAVIPHDDRLLLPDAIPLPPQGKPPSADSLGGFSHDDGTRIVVAELGRAEVWSCQIGDGRLVQHPFVALPSETCERGWSPSEARAIAADILRAADLCATWESWTPELPSVGLRVDGEAVQ